MFLNRQLYLEKRNELENDLNINTIIIIIAAKKRRRRRKKIIVLISCAEKSTTGKTHKNIRRRKLAALQFSRNLHQVS